MARYHGFLHRKEGHLGYWWHERDNGALELVFNQYNPLVEGATVWGISRSWIDHCDEYVVLDDLPDKVHAALAVRALMGDR